MRQGVNHMPGLIVQFPVAGIRLPGHSILHVRPCTLDNLAALQWARWRTQDDESLFILDFSTGETVDRTSVSALVLRSIRTSCLVTKILQSAVVTSVVSSSVRFFRASTSTRTLALSHVPASVVQNARQMPNGAM